MAQTLSMDARHAPAELASSLPRYDPLVEEKRTAGKVLVAVSILLHLLLLTLFWDSILGLVFENEDTVTVKMFEEEVPEPPKQKRKVLAQRVIDTSVLHRQDVIQPEVLEVKPTEVLDQVQKVDVQRTELTEAPKEIEHREVVTENVSVFADRPAAVAPQRIQTARASVTRVKTARPTSGPRKLQAAAPVVVPRAAKINAPTVTRGVVGSRAVDGDVTGAKIARIESGTDDKDLLASGDRGSLIGDSKDCMKDPICRAYLEEIKRRVYSRWDVPRELSGGKVVLAFRVDRGGSAHSIERRSSSDAHLGSTCMTAFRHASPFPPPPKEIHYIVNKTITATFTAN